MLYLALKMALFEVKAPNLTPIVEWFHVRHSASKRWLDYWYYSTCASIFTRFCTGGNRDKLATARQVQVASANYLARFLLRAKWARKLAVLRALTFQPWRTTGSDLFSFFCLHTTTFILFSIFSPVKIIKLKIWGKTYVLACESSLPLSIPGQSRPKSSSLLRMTEGEKSSGKPCNRRLSHWFSRRTKNTLKSLLSALFCERRLLQIHEEGKAFWCWKFWLLI